MRIGYDGKRATQNFRGLGNYSRGIIEGVLDYTKHDVVLYSARVKDERAKKWLNHLKRPLDLKGPVGALDNKIPAFWRSFSIVNDLVKDNLDLYHGLSHEIPYGSNNQQFKTVVTIHDLIFMRYPEFFPWIDRLTYKKKFTYATQKSDLVLAICEQTKDDLITMLNVDPKKILVHYQSCDPVFYEERSFEVKKDLMKKYHFERPFILCVGAVEERKNQLKLIEAFASISNKIEQDLVIVGQGKDYYQECVQLVSKLKLEARVRFLSNIPFAELPVFYQTADLFCFPSYFEGFGIPIVEALFSKTPVLTSHGSCFPESAGPDSVYIDPYSAQDIANGILTVLESVEKQELMITRGHAFVQKFHRQNVTQKLLETYATLF